MQVRASDPSSYHSCDDNFPRAEKGLKGGQRVGHSRNKLLEPNDIRNNEEASTSQSMLMLFYHYDSFFYLLMRYDGGIKRS